MGSDGSDPFEFVTFPNVLEVDKPALDGPTPKSHRTPEMLRINDQTRSRWADWATIFGLIGTVCALIGTVCAVISLYYEVRRSAHQTQEELRIIQRELRRGDFKITSPLSGGGVELADIVIGEGGYGDRFQYLVVRPLEAGDFYVQDAPVNVSGGGMWTGEARFGEAGVGIGQRFLVEAIATHSQLSPGAQKLPTDAIVSNPVVVTRTK